MKNYKISILAAGMLLIGGTVGAQTANVPVKKQSQNEWCWATDSQCILEYYGKKFQQCEIVEYARSLQPSTFGSTPCCTNPSGKCNNPNELKYNYGVTGMLDHFGNIKSIVSDGPISASKVSSELSAQRPFVIGISWSSGGGHVVVGCGFNSSTNSMTIMDSWTGSKTTSKYNSNGAISTGSGSGTWIETLVVTTPFSTTGIDKIDVSSDINVYPNPSEGLLNIQSVYNLKTINVYNTTGQLVDSYAVAGEKTYTLKIVAAGLYNVQLVTDNGIAYKKVVVSNN